jgi:peptidoglycan/xylan/chitin deacetylase (PgdA/CDA1 family)
MYHAIPKGTDNPYGADARYAVALGRFQEHIGLMRQRGLVITSVARRLDGAPAPAGGVALTFDDGHISNYEHAYPYLKEHGVEADFFINPASVARPGFASWLQLREMAAHGMSIQSHSFSHRFLDDLSEAELRDELIRSKKTIEDKVGVRVRLLAPPGGRLTSRAIALAAEIGYEGICGSQPGRWDGRVGQGVVPRFAVLATTPVTRLQRWVDGDWLAVSRERSRYRITYAAKKILGNGAYVKLRGWLLGQKG